MRDQLVDITNRRRDAEVRDAKARARKFARVILIAATALSFAQGILVAQELESANALPSDNLQTNTRVYYDGAETIGRVGQVAILRRDVLHQIKKLANIQYLAEIEKLPEDVREERRKEYKEGILNGYLNSRQCYSQVLDEHIRLLLFYNDYVVSRPKDQVKEQTEQMAAEFMNKVVPELLKQFHCKNVKELEEYYEKEIQSDFEQEKRIFVQHQLAMLWMEYNLDEENFNPTLAELKRYYETNREKYRVEPKIRWQCMTVYYDDNQPREEARKKIAHMGNAVQSAPKEKQEALFAKVCRVDSEDSFAHNGGYRTSSTRGALKSEQLEDAVFGDDLPVGALSRIIEEPGSFVIARVVERERGRVKSFFEVQEEVREQIVDDRKEAMKKKYEEKLSERFTVEIYALTEEDRERRVRSARRDDLSATGRR